MQHHGRWRAGRQSVASRVQAGESFVTRRIANVITVIISIESITDVKECSNVRSDQVGRFTTVVQKVAERDTQTSFVRSARGRLREGLLHTAGNDEVW